MRLMLLPLALMVSGHAGAEERTDPRPGDVAQLAETLNDPAVQTKVSALVSALANALLDTHVGPLARYANPREGIRPDDTLGDLVRRDDPEFDRRLRQRTRGAVQAVGQAAHNGAAMSSELARTVDRLRSLLDSTTAGSDDR